MTNEIVGLHRTRSRVLSEQVIVTKPDTKIDTKKLEELIVEVRALNDAKNEATRAYDNKRKELLVLMEASGMTKHSFDLHAEVNGFITSLTYSAEVANSTMESIDPAILYSKVDSDTFLKMVSVSKKSAEEWVGTSVINQCIKTKVGERNVTVSLKKQK